MKNPFQDDIPLFNNQFTLVTIENEFRMSHWVKGFGIDNTQTKEVLIPFNSSYNLIEFEEKENLLQIRFNVYPDGGKEYKAVIDLFNKTFNHMGQSHPLDAFRQVFK